jgi:CRISPR-associated protein Csx17
MEKGRELRGCWKDEAFCLCGLSSNLNRGTLCQNLLQKWNPNPFERWWKKAQAASKKDPDALLKLRASESDDRVEQLDAVIVQADRRVFNDVFGTGGNVAKRNLEQVWKRCWALSRKAEARSWLEQTLFGIDDVALPELEGASTWFAFSNKMFNSGQDWYRKGRLSPWSFLLAVEGSLLLRGAVHRRLGTRTKGRAVFPFVCRPLEPANQGEVARGRSEFWAPLWAKPATMAEIEALFRLGLAEVGGHPASAPHEFACAALDASVDAGISALVRFELGHTTSAQTFEAVPREHVRVPHQDRPRHSQLLMSIVGQHWIDRLPLEPKDPKQRGKFVGLRGPVEAAIVHVAEDPNEADRWKDLLVLLSRTQQRIDRNKNLRERCRPVPRLHSDWFQRAWPDPPPELCVARAIASIDRRAGVGTGAAESDGPLLANIFGVTMTHTGVPMFPKARPNGAVWHSANPTRALIEVLRRRLMSASEFASPPLYGHWPCSLATIQLYLAGATAFDDDVLARWLPPLTLIDWRRTARDSKTTPQEPDRPLHPLYSLFRPVFDAGGVVVNGRPLFPLSDSDSRKPHATSVRWIANLVLQNRIDDAVAHARRRYLAAGWRTFDPPPGELTVNAERLVAALLIPVNPWEVAARFCRDWLFPHSER